MEMAPDPQTKQGTMATSTVVDLLDIDLNNEDPYQASTTPTLTTVQENEESTSPSLPTTESGAVASVDLLGLEDRDYLKSTNQITEKTMALNEAYEAMEQMRQANLEIEFGRSVDPSFCVHSLRDKPETLTRKSRITGKPIARRTKKTCLLCGTPTCSKYASKIFADNYNIRICVLCAPLFTLDFVVDSATVSEDENPEDASKRQREKINHMVDTYDRVILLLKYSAQYIEEISITLEATSKRNDKIGLGTNTSGIMSGIAGVAGALTILTPAGPPLLIASLLFGGSAQASHAGTRAVNYFSSANKLAARIIAYYQLARSVLGVTCVLRDALLKDRIDLSQYLENVITQDENAFDLTYGYSNSKSFDDDDSILGLESVSSPTKSKDANTDGKGTDSEEKKSEDGSGDEEVEEDDDATAYFVISQPGAVDESDTGSISSPKASISPKSVTTPKSAGKEKASSPSKKTKALPPPREDADPTQAVSTKHGTAKFFSRAGVTSSSLAGVASFTYLAGFTLSALHVAFEAKNMTDTIRRLQAGSPCKRAETLRLIKQDIEQLPETGVISQEWEKYLKIVKEKREKSSVDVNE